MPSAPNILTAYALIDSEGDIPLHSDEGGFCIFSNKHDAQVAATAASLRVVKVKIMYEVIPTSNLR